MTPMSYRFIDIADELSKFDVTGMIYLRAQEFWTTSQYGQKVWRNHRFDMTFSKFLLSLRDRLTYSKLLDKISTYMPLDHLVVGDFARAARSGLLADFLKGAAIPSDTVTSTGEEIFRRTSLPHWATLFLLKCNQADIPAAAFLDVRRALAVHAASESELGLRPGIDLATPEERQGLRKVAAADEARLAHMYGVMLSDEIRKSRAYRSFDEDDFRAIRAAIAPALAKATHGALKTI